MLRACLIDFNGDWHDHLPLIDFVYNNSYHSSIGMAPFEALYGSKCRSPIGWFEVGEVAWIGTKLVHEAMDKVQLIRERLKMTQSRQKSYTDIRRRDLEFYVDGWVYLKISPMKGIMRFGKKRKLSPRYVGPYQIMRRIGKVAYELDLPNDLASVHLIFHVSLLKCVRDLISIVPLRSRGIKESLSYKEIPIEILDRQVKNLRNKNVTSVKVLWRNKRIEGATWEAEANMMSCYSYLFHFDSTLARGI